MYQKLIGFVPWRRGREPGGLKMLSFFLLLVSFGCAAEEVATSVQPEGAYPLPRYPRYLVETQPEDLLEAARVAVRQPTGRSPLGKMESGQTVYVLIQWGQDMEVWEAIKQAWAERDIEAHTVGYWDIMGLTKEEYEARVEPNLVYGQQGWKELGNFETEYKPFFPEEIQKEFGESLGDAYVRQNFVAGYLDQHPEIEYLFAGYGGGGFWQRAIGEKHAEKFVGNWVYRHREELLSKAAEFPPDVWNLVEERVLQPVPFVSEVTMEDPEGTNLHWLLTPEEAQFWTRNVGSSNHIFIYPSPLHSTLQGGVVQAAANHTGIYPTMRVQLDKNGLVERIGGGGKTGELFRMLVEHPKFKNAQFPGAPESGYWFLRQDGFATNPKFVRSMAALTEGDPWLANNIERNRAGVQHLAFGYPASDPKDREYAQENEIPIGPLGHTAHMHIYFPTAKWKLRDTGEWITIAEKGYIKAFDDAEVRALAAKYGDPELIFRYEWIPSIPGVNVPGDYGSDYASDPWKWLMEQWQKISAGTYEYYVEDYSLEGPFDVKETDSSEM
ncbi:hypothetical protein MYX82_07795 [Acidobacteria bacterium AH-259-D05]|nr:hypothetical protein [Acidobacteria bacterium AH-259-D05]